MLTYHIPKAIITDSLRNNVTDWVWRPASGRVEHGYALSFSGCIYNMWRIDRSPKTYNLMLLSVLRNGRLQRWSIACSEKWMPLLRVGGRCHFTVSSYYVVYEIWSKRVHIFGCPRNLQTLKNNRITIDHSFITLKLSFFFFFFNYWIQFPSMVVEGGMECAWDGHNSYTLGTTLSSRRNYLTLILCSKRSHPLTILERTVWNT